LSWFESMPGSFIAVLHRIYMSLTAIILAAGKSTRMKSARAKPLHDICGRPMLQYVLDACFGAGCDRVLAVVGYGKDEVIDRFGSDSRIDFVEQGQQLGTGHAVKVCQSALKGRKGEVFILAGDGPLIRSEILEDLLAVHRKEQAVASMATANLDDPTGYGRVVRDASGKFVAIVEQLDATPEQRAIKEVFPSYYCVNVEALNFALDRLKNENKKGEYYLTDIFGILRDAGQPIAVVQAVLPEDVLAVNDREQQAQVDAIMHRCRAQHLYRSRNDDRPGYDHSSLYVHRRRQPNRPGLHDRPVRRGAPPGGGAGGIGHPIGSVHGRTRPGWWR
jgi:bifunctional UDP-N-acetylglucosamine pyrophosphorylase/glucosamine-1-phosphate N-acetyltransferase